MLDAPVSGGVMAAETATLTFMVCVAYDIWFIHEIHYSWKDIYDYFSLCAHNLVLSKSAILHMEPTHV